MNQKIKGILTSVGTLISLLILTIVIAVIVSATSTDGWAGLGAAIMMVFVIGIVMIILLVVGILKYSKDKSQFGLGLVYGIIGIVVFGIGFALVTSIYNMFV